MGFIKADCIMPGIKSTLLILSTLFLVLFPPAVSLAEGFDSIIERGASLARAGRHPEAVEAFTEAIGLNPSSAEAYYMRASSYTAEKSWGSALLDLNETLRLDPKHVKAYIARGTVHATIGDNRKALRDFDEAVRLDPKNVLAYRVRGGCPLKRRGLRGCFTRLQQGHRARPWLRRGIQQPR